MTAAIAAKRLSINRHIDWALYDRQRAIVARRFPAAITRSGSPTKLPLAHGIREMMLEADTGLSSEAVDHFLRAYTFGPKYLRAIVKGADRIDLQGYAVGRVTHAEAWFAKTSLDEHHKAVKARRRAKYGAASAEAA